MGTTTTTTTAEGDRQRAQRAAAAVGGDVPVAFHALPTTSDDGVVVCRTLSSTTWYLLAFAGGFTLSALVASQDAGRVADALAIAVAHAAIASVCWIVSLCSILNRTRFRVAVNEGTLHVEPLLARRFALPTSSINAVVVERDRRSAGRATEEWCVVARCAPADDATLVGKIPDEEQARTIAASVNRVLARPA